MCIHIALCPVCRLHRLNIKEWKYFVRWFVFVLCCCVSTTQQPELQKKKKKYCIANPGERRCDFLFCEPVQPTVTGNGRIKCSPHFHLLLPFSPPPSSLSVADRQKPIQVLWFIWATAPKTKARWVSRTQISLQHLFVSFVKHKF